MKMGFVFQYKRGFCCGLDVFWGFKVGCANKKNKNIFCFYWKTVPHQFCHIEYFFIPSAIFYSYCEGRIFFVYRADIVWDVQRFIPNSLQCSFVRKNKHTDKQTNKQTFDTKEKEKTETETVSKKILETQLPGMVW